MIYLDNSATTRVCSEAAAAAAAAMREDFGNPSAVHGAGIKAKTLLEKARAQAAKTLSCRPDEVYFSHSGTLANNTAVFGAALSLKKRGNRIVTTAAEHPSVGRCMDALEARGFEVIRLAPSADGGFDPQALLAAVNEKTVLVSAMLVNNETGAVNPVHLLRRAVQAAGAPALVHTDAVQGFGKLPVSPAKLGTDLLTASGHKLHAPKGVGLLYIKKGVYLPPFVNGGGQENGMFSGTEPLPAIAGFGAALAALPDPAKTLPEMQNKMGLLRGLLSQIPSVRFNSPENALPYILNFSLSGVPSQVLINYLSAREIYVSAGSACKKGRREVLTAMGLAPDRIDSAIRASLSRETTEEEIRAFAAAVKEAAGSIRTKL